MKTESNKTPPKPTGFASWIGSAGVLFAGLTIIPLLVGWAIGVHLGHEQYGAGAGAVVGFVLAIRCVIVPIWRDADGKKD